MREKAKNVYRRKNISRQHDILKRNGKNGSLQVYPSINYSCAKTIPQFSHQFNNELVRSHDKQTIYKLWYMIEDIFRQDILVKKKTVKTLRIQ